MSSQGKRIEANCKIIWGEYHDYDLSIDTNDYVLYDCYVRKDFGTSFGPPLTMASASGSREKALNELDRILGLWAAQVKRGTPMTK
jgi:hypothetical protein